MSAAQQNTGDGDESNGYMTGNIVENSEGGRKEIPQVNELGN